jgi:transposase-like protein
MKQEKLMLCGTVEADETYIGATKSLGCWAKPHVPIVGMVQRKGKVIAKVLPNFKEENIVTFVQNSLRKGSTLYTDGAPVYNICQGYKRGVVIHSKKEYVRGDIHTNTIEGFWSHLKRPLRGTYASVSRKYLQSYVDERVFTWNNRQDAFEKLLAKI